MNYRKIFAAQRGIGFPCWILCGTSVFLTACATGALIDPDRTTYPRERVVNVTNMVPLPVPIRSTATVAIQAGKNPSGAESIEYSPGTPVLTSNFESTIVGDSAEVEIYIVPRNRREFQEQELLARLEEGGARACKGDYRVANSKYFFGSEATLGFLNIKTPALRVVYRCPLFLARKLSPSEMATERLSKQFVDAAYFDVSEKQFKEPKDLVHASILQWIQQRNLSIIKQGEGGDGRFVIAGVDPNSLPSKRGSMLVAIVADYQGGSRLTFKLLSYSESRHQRGVLKTEKPGFSRGAQPVSRKVAYELTRGFLGDLSTKLSSK